MVEKTHFHQLMESPEPEPDIAPDTKACVNCAHARPPEVEPGAMPTTTRFVLCKRGPPSPVFMPTGLTPNQFALRNRWPAMGYAEECDMFCHKKVDEKRPPGAY